MDTELFMECEEEELEPWQQVDDDVEEDDVDFSDNDGEPVEDPQSPSPATETPSPQTASITPAPTVSPPVQTVSSAVMALPPLPVVTSPPPSVAHLPSPLSPAAATPTLMPQVPPLILSQTPGGTFLLPAAPVTGSTPPILLTTQAFPMQTVVNPGTPLILNLQPGQTVQPLTLIQSSPLSQLVQGPSVGVSPILSQGQTVQTRPGPVSSAGTSQPGTTFTTMQLPATLTIHSTPPPINIQMNQMGGTNSMKLIGSPAFSSISTNGVTKVTVISSMSQPGISTAPALTASVITTSSVASAPSSSPHKMVMSVDDFYYGTFEGDPNLRKPQSLGIKPSTFICQICTHLAESNLGLMQHMIQHSELLRGGEVDKKTCCSFCHRQFSSPGQLATHQEQVHGPTPSSSMCRICEWAFENEPAFLNHMKSNHKPGEMPYICQVCKYRSSFYSDVVRHFTSFHRHSRFLLCVFCLKVTRNPISYQQHLLRHQINQAFHCNWCRLQFVLLKDRMQHKLEHHRSFRRPAQLEGLPPGSKVTIRTYREIRRQSHTPIQPIHIKTESRKSLIQEGSVLSRSPQSLTRRPVSRRVHDNRTASCDEDRLVCLECGTDVSDFSAHYPSHVHCLLCPYSSCCSRAYAAHMIHHHVPRCKDRVVPLHRLPPPCRFLLQCVQCDFSPQSADDMAKHLLMNPEHHSATCCNTAYVEPDIHPFCHDKVQTSSEERESNQNQDLPDPSWKSATCWNRLAERDSPKITIIPFTGGGGPCHYLNKNSDAIDFFNLLFPTELIELITNETNSHAKTCQFLGSFQPDWLPVTTHEIKGFIGLVILMGIQSLPDPSHYWSWSHYDNSYTFYRAMSFRRFQQIAANIRMGSFTTDQYRGTQNQSDSLHIFRPLLAILGRTMWSAYRPNCCLTIDRALLPRLEEESCDIKGNPENQPHVWLLCDSKSGYCHRLFIQVDEAGSQELGFIVVPELVKGLEDKHHQLYLANSLTSVPLMQKLLDQGLYASSSFPPPNPILPRELWEEGQLEKPGDFLQRQFGPLLATRWRDTKEMGCLSTNAAAGEADIVWRRSQTKVGSLDPINRPMAFRLLQENMRGVDICKQLLSCNPLGGIPLDRHWRSLFWFLVNLSIVNAFIILRESRKENPPAWVQDGIFTQVSFRQRLGNQLAKCAQKHTETIQIASSREVKVEVTERVPRQRHRLAKISAFSKRCKNCILKNIRHESIYGCVACRASLCKQPSCFWEYHGLPPHCKGSTRVGFLKEEISDVVKVDEVDDNIDEAMAPVEHMDFSDNERDHDLDDMEVQSEGKKEEVIKEAKWPVPHLASAHNAREQPTCQPANQATSLPRDDVLTARQLRIALFALCDGLRQASRVFSTESQLIRTWLKEAKMRLKQSEQEQNILSEGGDRMVAWVLSMREQQLPITESSFFQEASTLKKKGSFSDTFRISYDWAVSFMLQRKLSIRSTGTAATHTRNLPAYLEAKVKTFREFTLKIFHTYKLSESSVAAMDELCLFVDLRLVQDRSCRSEALELIGSLPLVTVYLTALADGTMLPSLILANRQLVQKALPEFILLEAGPECLLVEEALDLWTNKVWIQHMSDHTQPCKSILVLDGHRSHMNDQFLTSVSGCGTLPAVIPGGCSFGLQPLEVCVKPVLQHVLLLRWQKFTSGNPKELEETSPQRLQASVTQLLVDWVVEALMHLNKVPQVWRESFRMTRLLLKDDVEMDKKVETSKKLRDLQLDLLKTLTETFLSPELLESNFPDLLGLEDEEDTNHKTKQETSEARQLHKKETQMETEKGKETQEKGMTEDTSEQGDIETDNKDDMDSDEEGKEEEEPRREVNRGKPVTRIVMGENVGDEWTMTNRTEAPETDSVVDNRMDMS